MSLEILMGTQKGHSAYRMAWANTSSPRIPFLPLHRRDLVSAEEGNRTFLGADHDRINWKKFEVMGDAIVSIQKSQAIHYPELERRLDIQSLLLEIELLRDEDVSDARFRSTPWLVDDALRYRSRTCRLLRSGRRRMAQREDA